MKLTHSIHTFLVALVLILTVSVYGFWYTTVSKKSAEAVGLMQEIHAKQQDTERMQEVKDQLEKLSVQEATVQSYFVSINDVVPFLESLQTTGKNLGTTIQVVSVSADPGKPHSHLNLSLSITGPFDSVVKTLGALEYAPYDTLLQSLTLDTPQTEGGGGQWTANAIFFIGTTDAASTTARSNISAATSIASTTASTTP